MFSFLSDSEFENEIFDQIEEIGVQANEQQGFGDTTQNSSSESEVDEAARQQAPILKRQKKTLLFLDVHCLES